MALDVWVKDNFTNKYKYSENIAIPMLNNTEDDNITAKNSPCGSVNDIELDRTYRLMILYLTIVLCLIGSVLVILWMCCNRRIFPKFKHYSRVNVFILHLTVADLLVIMFAMVPQLAWEHVERDWRAGDIMCRLVKFLQSFSMMASNYMVVVIAIDRHQAIRAPLKEAFSIWKMAGTGWGLAALFSLPVTGVFHTVAKEDGETRCENIFRNLPHWHRQIWMTWVAFVVFFIPFVMLVICYLRIFMKISKKALQNSSVKYRQEKGKIYLQSTHSSSLPRAKIKTLKMTFVILLTFIICSMPYFVAEMIMSYGNYCLISKQLYAILGGMAACNSATNPYVFLAFNINTNWFKHSKIVVQNRSNRHFAGTIPVPMGQLDHTPTIPCAGTTVSVFH
ncbi:V1AR-like protein [Mya arenaria]|uniref:V1AR-like protein n=1 Tax=Mya arenaria TaxID=6604 RepID=A0ABY7DMG1_MYAAR|nr:V1AR-like protein [Mya arenaria]